MNCSETRIIVIDSVEKFKPYISDLCKLYKEVFCSSPHNESLSYEEIGILMSKIVSSFGGVLVLMIHGDELIGFSSGFELVINKEMSLLWDMYGKKIDQREIFLFHRSVIKDGFREKGFGEQLIKVRNNLVDKKYQLLLHYTHEHNKVASHIYKTAGFEFIEPCFQILARS